ncbi:hypothetical protein LEMLEM_LOCUS18707 [Lemmus lemmus]
MDSASLCRALKHGLREDLTVTPHEICSTAFISLRARPFPSGPPEEMHPPSGSWPWEGPCGLSKGSWKLGRQGSSSLNLDFTNLERQAGR